MSYLNILIVEDETGLAELYADFIKKNFNFRVANIASTLADAKKMIQVHDPDLILLDNYLPDGRGLELIKFLVSSRHQANVIFITAATDMETITEAIRLGVFDYLVKPVPYPRLQRTLERYNRYISSLNSGSHATQSDVDLLFNMQRREIHEPVDNMQKSIDGSTLEKIKSLFHQANTSHTADSLTDILGCSKTTARRYLEFLTKSEGFLEAEIVYGKVGRPERIYRKLNKPL